MTINEMIQESGMTKYRIAKISGVPHTTLNDLCSGKSRIEKCSAETLFRLAKALKLSMEFMIENAASITDVHTDSEGERERSYEYGLPEYLQKDLDAYKEGLEKGSDLMDCLWGELYGSINVAEITDGVITPEHAEYLRQKYLWR